MTKKEMCIGRASLNEGRMLRYKRLALAFSYPASEALRAEHDRLFRSNEIWLYGLEYSAENEFERAMGLADINGFYKAFGLQADKDRPDSLCCELEFMHFLIFKENAATSSEKASVCRDAQRKFFLEHLYPAAKKIAERIVTNDKDGFYCETSKEMLAFLESELKELKGV